MGYCPKCAVDGDHEKDGEIQWHRKCALVVLGALLVESVPRDAYRYHPKE